MSRLKTKLSKPLYCCYLFALLTPSSLYALTLNDAINASLSSESQLKVSQLNVKQSAAMLNQAQQRDGLKVNLVGQLDYEKIDTPKGVLFPTEGNRKGRSAQLQLDYPIYTSGRHSLGIDIANKQLEAQSEALLDQESETILNTVVVYTDVLKYQSILELKTTVLSNLQRSLFEAQRRFDAGVITRADLAQVSAQVAQGKADVTQADSNLKISRGQFYQVTGLDGGHLETVKDLPNVPHQLDQILQKTQNHPSLKQVRYERQAAEKQLALSKRELWPTVNLTSRIGKQNEANYINSESNNYMVGIQLNMPLYDDGLNRANIKKAQVDIDLADQKLRARQLDLDQRVKTSHARLESIRQNKIALQNAIDAASIALTYIQKEFQVGTKTTFDILTAQQKLLDLQTQKVLNNQDEVVLVYQLLDQMSYLNNSFINSNNSINPK